MKRTLVMLFVLISFGTFSQKTCDKPKEGIIEDLNSISVTKCTIESSKKSKNKRARRISVNVSAPKRRYLKKRVITKKGAVAGLEGVGVAGVTKVNGSYEFAKSLELRNSVAKLTNNLSAAEVRAASKFLEVDQIPMFEKCKEVKKNEAMDCFNNEMVNHIQKHFSYPVEAIMKKTEGKVWVRFVIDKDGKVTNIKTLGPKNGELLKLEAKRVASKLPKFTSAIKGGKKVAVKYGFPINFSLEQ